MHCIFVPSNHQKDTFSASVPFSSNTHALLHLVDAFRLGCAQYAHTTGKTGPHATHGRRTEWCKKEHAVVDVVERGCGCVDLDLWKLHSRMLDTFSRIDRSWLDFSESCIFDLLYLGQSCLVYASLVSSSSSATKDVSD
jgi:hypothetical protein